MPRKPQIRVITLEGAVETLWVLHGRARGIDVAIERMEAARKKDDETADRFWQAVAKLIGMKEET